MTQPAGPPVRDEVDGSDTHESRQDGDPQLATGAQAHDDTEHQIAWLSAAPEVAHPGPRGSRRRTIGLSALAIVVPGLAVAAMAHFPAPGPVPSEITAPPTGARSLARPAMSTNAQPTVPPVPVDTTVTSATAAEAPVSPVSLVPVSAAPEPPERLPIAGGATEHHSSSRHQPLASPPSSAPASPKMTAARRPSSGAGKRADTPPSQLSSDQQGNQSRWDWKKTTTCDSSGCVDHYNPAPSGQ